ncbi:Phosphatidylethanolamine-binding protein 1 [Thelohanellus kitauei]|uniref:Phosphatidylethanolamine-binding protein 1 n=1 Tax=Thelohanellus kitauei TaxID=669202 RepID=A0A0C2J0D3_THEKT|nr:Phosphatidylethanolamine-binding protein 1 [Thelohanellus kitauei]
MSFTLSVCSIQILILLTLFFRQQSTSYDGYLDEWISLSDLPEIDIEYLGRKIDYNTYLKFDKTKFEPNVGFTAKPTKYYTLILTDLDAKSSDTNNRETYHWVVVNIKGNDLSTGNRWFDYRSPTPNPVLGWARYYFFVFEQKGLISLDEPIIISTNKEGRGSKNSLEFAKKYDLNRPVSMMMFLSVTKED